jgi:ribonuclease HII
MRESTANLWSFDLETAASCGGVVAGMDEAGRGPLAGPVVAACVVMPLDDPIDGVNDSKKLTAARREKLYPLILSKALAVGVGRAEHDEIDRVNILQATKNAMRRAYEAMDFSPALLLVDAVDGLGLPVDIRPIVRGDGTSYHIAAASIVAKVTRDRLMDGLDALYPEYGFAAHKGYGTAEHLSALRRLGPCGEHRASFIGSALGATKQEKGRAGEDMAEKLLMAEGIEVLERNWRCPTGELDIVAQDGRTLAFVEVKYRESAKYGAPREAVHKRKRRNIAELAAHYLREKGRAGARCRFDVVEIVKHGVNYSVSYMKGAFSSEGGDLFL